MSTSSAENVAAALKLAAYGLNILHLHTVNSDGSCTCGDPTCRSIGKHPIADLLPHGVKDATTHEPTIRQRFALFPDANIGVATGPDSGVWVLDSDTRHGGDASLEQLQARYGDLPHTWEVATGSGGLHLWFRNPAGVEIRNIIGTTLGPGLDVNGRGRYVVAPPSRHRSGNRYEWNPLHRQLADAPDWLLRLVTEPDRSPAAPLEPDELIAEGQRNALLTSLGGTMRRRGFRQESIVAALMSENRLRCRPPLDEREVERIAESVARYQPVNDITNFPSLPSGLGGPGGRESWRRLAPPRHEYVGGEVIAR